MNGVLIDSCVLLDLFSNDDNWGNWSENILEHYSRQCKLNCVSALI